MSYSSMEIYSPPNREIKLENVDDEEAMEDDNMPYTVPSVCISEARDNPVMTENHDSRSVIHNCIRY